MRLGSALFAHALTVVGLLQAGMSAAEAAKLPQLYTNESYVNEAIAGPVLKIGDPLAVFAYVLGQLPDRVKVYPTEHYYYFKFFHNHVRYAGNIRFDILDRDQGKVHFAYFQDLSEWKDDEPVKHVILDARQGVTVEKLGAFAYRVSHAGKSVTFELNDLRNVRPPAGALGLDEIFIGPVFDESAIRFFLVFNKQLKVFHYVLDETVPVADQLLPGMATERILIGKRTGFAFYRDHRLDRKILIGVFQANSRINNYFDGPFDQLPDDFIEGEVLRDAILAVDPQLRGKIDRLGISPGGDNRYSIAPYIYYRTEADLERVHTCATDKAMPADRYYECFVWEDDGNPDSETQSQQNMQTDPNRQVERP